MRFRFIDAERAGLAMPIFRLCRLLQVSVSGFYAWRNRGPSQRQLDDMVLLAHVRAAFRRSRESYGAERVHHELAENGIEVGRHRVARLMRGNGLSPKRQQKFKKTTDSQHNKAVASNLLDQNFSAEAPNEKWAADISYIWTAQGWLYLAVMLDFDPLILAGGKTDLFVVAPEDPIEHVKGWLRLWVAIPNAVAGIKPLKRDLLIVIDEMSRLGYLKPVMDGYTMAAGKGVHFWCFAQSISALDSTWGKEHRKALLHLAELVQILGFPRTDAEGAEELSKAIGTATFETRTENRSGTIAENRIVTANTQWQAGDSRALVRERLITPDELMTLGPDRQYVIAAPKDMPRDALHLHHARYWRRWDSRDLADPNPFVIRKDDATDSGETWTWPRFKLPFGGKTS